MKSILTGFITILTMSFCFSQDLITMRSGEDIQVKILEVSQDAIKYKKYDNLEGPVFTINKADALMIRYENGTKDIFNEVQKTSNVSSAGIGNTDQYVKGQSDAMTYYRGYKGAGTGTLITTLLFPIAGLIPAVACSSTKPKEINLNYPKSELMKNQDYYNGYTQKAKKIKQGKVWKNFGIGVGVNILAYIILSS